MTQVVTDYDVRCGAVASISRPWIIYIDPRIPTYFWPYLVVHETVERKLMIEGGLSYKKAHKLANLAEKQAVNDSGKSWTTYSHALDGYLKRVEHQQVLNPPPDPHVDIDTCLGKHRLKMKRIR